MSDERGEKLRAAFQNTDRERRWPNQRPRDAATLIVLDRTGKRLKLLMGRRHPDLKFMPGKFVFPGGRLERSDRFMTTASELSADVEVRLSNRVARPSESRGRALALTALRETYEETGLVIGTRSDIVARKRAVPAGWSPFVEASILPNLGAMAFIGRAITPPRRPKRFDTRFFAIDRRHVCLEAEGFVGPDKELVELAWVDIEAARELELPRITLIMLEELEHRESHGPSGDVPVPFYREERGKYLRDLL